MNKKGFSLIEVLVVVAVFGVIVAIMLPHIQRKPQGISHKEGFAICSKKCLPNGVKYYNHDVKYCTCDLNVKAVDITNGLY
jgi:prepilin-type N-terminal cleavage/methylation domain-containing protein